MRPILRIYPLLCVCCLIASAARTAAPADLQLDLDGWHDDFASSAAWQAQPGWLADGSPNAKCDAVDGSGHFVVPEAGKGMKWSCEIPGQSISDYPYFALRYRARNVKTAGDDYFIYLDDGGPAQCAAVKLQDCVADGQWHSVVVDLTSLVQKPTVTAVAVQVQAVKPPGEVWIDWIGFYAEPPAGAAMIHGAKRQRTTPDFNIDPKQLQWGAHSDWLANPTSQPSATATATGEQFCIDEPMRGMKWMAPLTKPLALDQYQYVAVHYKAEGARPFGDYLLCVMSAARENGEGYRSAIDARELKPDGHWHTMTAEISDVGNAIPQVGALAWQVQAASSPAAVTVDSITFTNHLPETRFADLVPNEAAKPTAGFAAIPIANQTNIDVTAIARATHVSGLPKEQSLTSYGVPLQLTAPVPRAVCTPIKDYTNMSLPIGRRASEVFALQWAAFVGTDDGVRGGGKLAELRDVDRFRWRLEYTDGTVDECLPVNLSSDGRCVTEGPQVLRAKADPTRTLARLTVMDQSSQAAFAIVALTVRTAAQPLFPQYDEAPAPLAAGTSPLVQSGKQAPAIQQSGSRTVLSNGFYTATFDADNGLSLTSLVNRRTNRSYLQTPQPVLQVFSSDESKPLPLQTTTPPQLGTGGAVKSATFAFAVPSMPQVTVTVRLTVDNSPEIGIAAQVRNAGNATQELGLVLPTIGPFALSDEIKDDTYQFPQLGSILSNAPTALRSRYCGMFPVQFISTFNAQTHSGLYLRTEDRAGAWMDFAVNKGEQGTTCAVIHHAIPLAPGQMWQLPTARIGITDGDWRRGFEAYRNWVDTWYHPVAPRQQWFREVFNFRQRFLHGLDPLYDAATGQYHFDKALTEGRDQFGGIEYLHLFDWGNCGKYGRIYGRTGDYSPYDFLKGGQAALRTAIDGVQRGGVPVGLYIEGYLLQEKGKLGEAEGKKWQLVGRNGKGLYWPDSTEMFVCPWVKAWQKVQATTYAAKVRELQVNGMYIDEYGFADAGKDCYSPDHGHRVPAAPLLGERGMTLGIRNAIDAVRPNVALYSEDTPVDVTSQDQDGSFTYELNHAIHTNTEVPLNVFRFAIPTFKTFEILICDKKTGTWATGVKWVFFNGEGIWLEGPADQWFAPQTLAAIRRCHATLRKYKDAFTTDHPEPLVPTELGGVYANLFPTAKRRVYTLYNSRFTTVRGPVLRVPHRDGAKYYDAWHDRSLTAHRDGTSDVLSLEIGPQDVGCVVVE